MRSVRPETDFFFSRLFFLIFFFKTDFSYSSSYYYSLFIFPQKLCLGFLLFLKNWWLMPGPPGSAARVVTTVVTTEGSAGFRKVPLYFLKEFPLGRFRRVPRGSAKVPRGWSEPVVTTEGSARFLKVS